MEIVMWIWEFISINIIQQPAFLLATLVIIGYALLGKKWYEILAGAIKTSVGYYILEVGSNGLVSNFHPILYGLKEKYNLNAIVIDPYFGLNAVTYGIEEKFGKSFSQVMIVLVLAFMINIVLVRYNKYTKLRALFTTGHVQIHQSATAFWLVLFAVPQIREYDILPIVVVAVILGVYWSVGSNLTVKISQNLSHGEGFCLGHQQMFGAVISSAIAEKLFGNNKSKVKKIEDIKLPGVLSLFNNHIVCTSCLMLMFFGTILSVLGEEYFIENNYISNNQSFVFYAIEICLQFAVSLTILQLGVGLFVKELTLSFKGISNKLLPGALPGVDAVAFFELGAKNAIPIGFLSGFIGQVLAMAILLIIKSPVLVICGFIPVFFDNAIIAIFANEKGGIRAAIILPFFSGIIQVLGSAFIARLAEMDEYGGYLGMWDWAAIWPIMIVVMKGTAYVGIVVCLFILLAIPQIQYRFDKQGYFLIAKDYKEYKKCNKK